MNNQSLFIKEEHNESDLFSPSILNKGFHLIPSKVSGRPESIEGFILTATNDRGKVGYSNPNKFIHIDELDGVSIETPQVGAVLTFDGEKWIPSSEGVDEKIVNRMGIVVLSERRNVIIAENVYIKPHDKITVRVRTELPYINPLITLLEYRGEGIPIVSCTLNQKSRFELTIYNAHGSQPISGNVKVRFNF